MSTNDVVGRVALPVTKRQISGMSNVFVAPDALFLAFQAAVIGRYSLERELGRGGMGVVYLAREVRLDRLVAIKLLPPEFAAQDRLRDRFLREARTAARLSHPYIVPIHGVDEVGDFVFYVMAYIDGETLAQRVASRGPLPPADATRILREVAWALAYAHAQGVVHRDIKPANILIERGSERALVADFGIARHTHTPGETMVGELLGTPDYMSPEQATGEPVDGRSDLYALGAVGFFMLTGRTPFTAPTTQAMLAQQITKIAPSVTAVAHSVPLYLARAIDQCLEKDPARRPTTGEVLADALSPSLEHRSEIPVPVRVFLDRRRMVPAIIPGAMLLPGATGLLVEAMTAGHVGKGLIAVAAMAAGVTLPIGIVIMRLRSVLKRGYRLSDIIAAIRTRQARAREEFLYEFGQTISVRERLMHGGSLALLATSALSILGWIFGVPKAVAVPIAVMAGYTGGIMMVVGNKWRRLRANKGALWSKFWQSKPAQVLARGAGFKLRERGAPTNRPTELAIAMSAESLFGSFPKEMRASLGDVPGVLRSLEAHAQSARARIEELDAMVEQAQHAPKAGVSDERQAKLVFDLRADRARAETRLGEVVAALENVRLDLLRLHAGVGTPDGITQDLAAARALSDDAERLIAGVREVEASLEH